MLIGKLDTEAMFGKSRMR